MLWSHGRVNLKTRLCVVVKYLLQTLTACPLRPPEAKAVRLQNASPQGADNQARRAFHFVADRFSVGRAANAQVVLSHYVSDYYINLVFAFQQISIKRMISKS